MKTLRDVKNEYGKILRWTNGYGDENGNTYPYVFYLEDVNTRQREEIKNAKALDFISKKTVNCFRNSIDIYDNYVKLFEILGETE